MKTISATEFKAKCLSVLQEVNATGEPITVTKRGKVLAEVSRPAGCALGWEPGALKGLLVEVGDIDVDLADLGVEWEAAS